MEASSSNDVVTCGMSNDDDKVEAFSSIGRSLMFLFPLRRDFQSEFPPQQITHQR